MKKHVYPLQCDHLYHIYNRGINGCQLFFNHLNYLDFLKLMKEKVGLVADFYSYCLMKNHFHFLVKIKSEQEILRNFPDKNLEIEKIISQQFSNAFNSYTQAINKQSGRTGKLFELRFRRKLITTEDQLRNSILYINSNPKKHGLDTDLTDYPFSSAEKILMRSQANSEEIIEMFGNLENYKCLLLNYNSGK